MKNFLKYIICVILAMTSITGLMPVSADEGTTVKGFCTHLRNFSDNSKNLELVYNTGTKTLREDVYWISVERTKGVYNWNSYDWWMNELNEKGIDLYIAVTSLQPPEFYYSDTSKPFFSEQTEIDAFCNFLKALIKRYPFIKYIELWNEPNYVFGSGGTPNERMQCYVNMVKAASAAIRAVSTSIEIVGGCTAIGFPGSEEPRIDGRDFCDYVLPRIYQYVDAISWHTYVTPGSAEGPVMQERIDTIRDKLLKVGAWKKVYTSETGWVTGNVNNVSVTEDAQAYNIAKVFPIMEENDIDGTYIYDFRNDGNDLNETGHNFGLINYDGTPKESYNLFKEHLEKTDGYRHAGEIPISDSDKESHLYVGENGAVIMSWKNPEGNTVFKPEYKTISLDTAKEYFKDIVAEKYDKLAAKAKELNVDISSDITVQKNLTMRGSENEAFNGNFELGIKLLDMGVLGKISIDKEQMSDLLYDIYRIGERMSSVYNITVAADEDDVAVLKNKYDAFKETMKSYDDETVFISGAILDIGEEKLDNVRNNVCAIKSGGAGGVTYSLSETGMLEIRGSASPGSYVSLKIEKDNRIYSADTICADADGGVKYRLWLTENGTYSVSVGGTAQKCNSFDVVREEDTDNANNNVCVKKSGSASGVTYSLSGTGMLEIRGNASPGSYASLKIEKDNRIYSADTICADADGGVKYRLWLTENGTYSVSVGGKVWGYNSFDVVREEKFLSEEFIIAEYLQDYARRMLLISGYDDMTAYVERTGDGSAVFGIYNGNDGRDIRLLLCGYNDDRLVECQMETITLSAGEMREVPLSVKMKCGKVRAYVWEGDSLKPCKTVWRSGFDE